MIQRIPGPEDVGRFYDLFTRFFEIVWGESLHVGYWANGSTEGTIAQAQVRLTELMMSRFNVKEGAHVLDVGCGTGEPTLRLSRTKNCRATGVTISPKQVEAGRQRALREGMQDRVQFQHANAMALPFADESFDGAWALESLFHMSDTGLALSEILRCIKKNAQLVISDFTCRVPMTPEDEQFHRDSMQAGHLHSIEKYQGIIRSVGFELDETMDITAEMMRTAVLTRDGLADKREELRQAFGDELLGMLDSSWSRASEIGLKHQGYAIFVMHKP